MLSAAKHLASLHMCIFMGINFWNIEKYVILTHSDIMGQSQDWMLALRSFDVEAFPPGSTRQRQTKETVTRWIARSPTTSRLAIVANRAVAGVARVLDTAPTGTRTRPSTGAPCVPTWANNFPPNYRLLPLALARRAAKPAHQK